MQNETAKQPRRKDSVKIVHCMGMRTTSRWVFWQDRKYDMGFRGAVIDASMTPKASHKGVGTGSGEMLSICRSL
jgi:hypothetical protein